MQERLFNYQRTGRYYLSTAPQDKPYYCWVFHGHGQRPDRFLSKFTALQRRDICFIAPEGLHRYYLSGMKGKTGVSWMTSEAREQDIEDYLGMLDAIRQELSADETGQSQHFAIAFSQGVATASRWAFIGNAPFVSLTNWASRLPPDLDYGQVAERCKQLDLHFVFPSGDEYLSETMRRAHLLDLEKAEVRFTQRVVPGKHRMDAQTLAVEVERLMPLKNL